MLSWMILLFYLVSEVNAGFCTEAYTCQNTCYQTIKQKYDCGPWGWLTCYRSRVTTKQCTQTCSRETCCPGYTGENCDTPLCFGSTTCPNNGTCSSPDNCLCESGYSSPNCAALCFGSTSCPHNGTCLAPDSCLCGTGFSLPNCSDIDECLNSTQGCEHNCDNTPGSFKCSCNSGYYLSTNGTSCMDVNECETDNGGCEHSCTNEVGSYRCSCKDGHLLHNDSMSCNDIDECEINNGRCDQKCINEKGFHRCSCREGYILQNDSYSCADMDECEFNNGGCYHVCTNTNGSYACSCSSGYILHNDNASCTDVNECEIDNGGCEHVCYNHEGVYNCSCKNGYLLQNDNHSCADINECEFENGGCEHYCRNTNGSFSCHCLSGYELHNDTVSCTDIDECSNNNGECEQNCENTDGAFYCSCLDKFYLLSDNTSCECTKGFSLTADNKSCIDVNECEANNGGCDQLCKNEEGSFTCGCETGYRLENDGLSCVDVNECETKNGGCDQLCSNEEGSLTCSCLNGYTLQSDGIMCTDVNECNANNGGCQQQCINNEGSFSCSCNVHFALKEDGLTCENITERSISSAIIFAISSRTDQNMSFAHDKVTTISADAEIYTQAKHSLQIHFKKYTKSYFSIVIRRIRKFTSLKGESKVTLIVNYTIVYEKDEELSDTKDQLIRGTIDLINGMKLFYDGEPVQAKLHLEEKLKSPCDVYTKLIGGCDKGFQCKDIAEGPQCQYMAPATEEITGPAAYIVPILVAVVILAVVFVVIFLIRRKKKHIVDLSVKYRRHFSHITHDNAVENNIYQHDLNIENAIAVSGDHGNESEENWAKFDKLESEETKSGLPAATKAVSSRERNTEDDVTQSANQEELWTAEDSLRVDESLKAFGEVLKLSLKSVEKE